MISPIPGYVLLDPRLNAAEAPYTFFLPQVEELAAVSAGDHVQLMFEHVPPGQEWSVELMWVSVTEVDGERLGGDLSSKLFEPTASAQVGDIVRFERFHIIGIDWANADRSLPSKPRR